MVRHLLLAAIVAGIAAALLLGDRGWGLANRPRVDLVTELPARVDADKLRRFLDYSAIVLPGGRGMAAMAGDGAVTAPKLGFSYREVSIIGLPIYAYSDFGMALFDESPARIRMVPLDADYMKLLEDEAGGPLGRDYRLPYHRLMWGWGIVAAFLLWLVLQRRAEAHQREESGVI